jgi:hypothetical protein
MLPEGLCNDPNDLEYNKVYHDKTYLGYIFEAESLYRKMWVEVRNRDHHLGAYTMSAYNVRKLG